MLAFCCLVGEGAAADWSSVYLRDRPRQLRRVRRGRLRRLLDHDDGRAGWPATGWPPGFGPVRLVRGCGVLAASGLGLALLIGHPMAGVIGFGCFGAGLSCIVPQVFSAAGHRDPARAGQALARVASLGYIGFLTGPVLIGGAAELFGLPARPGHPRPAGPLRGAGRVRAQDQALYKVNRRRVM